MPPTIASRNVPERPIASENIDSVVAQSVSDAELGLKLFYQLGQIERTKDDADTCEQVLHELRRNAAAVGFAAQFWLASLHPHLTGLTKGQVVVIDLVSGRFVVASSRLAGVDAFEAEFGIDTTVGWLHQIGGGVVLGGGIA